MATLCYVFTLMPNLVICKPRTLNDGGEDSVKYRNRKSTASYQQPFCFLSIKLL